MSHDIEAEQAIIGTVLMKNEVFHAVSEMVSAGNFFEIIHAQIWEVCSTLIAMGKMASPISVRQFLPADMPIGGTTLQGYLARLAAASCPVSEVMHMAALVRDLADRRTIAGVAAELTDAKPMDVSELASWGIEQLDSVVASRNAGQVPSLDLNASVTRAIDSIAIAFQNDGALTGMSYGLRDLDRKTSGLTKGELTILAGRPGMFKTGLALNFSRALGLAGHKGIFFSLEMGDVSLSRRLISDMMFDEYELSHFRMKAGRFKEEEFRRITDAAERLAHLPLRIEQQSGLSISQISARARQMKRRGGLDYIVVDHMGHVQASDRYRGSKVNEVGEISAGLLRLARELDVAVIALAQLSRGVESRDNKKPTISDLRDSGNIEQDAATILMVYREAYYLQNAEPRIGTPEYEVWQDKMSNCLHDLEIIIGKQRDGSTGTVRAYVDVTTNAVRDHGWTRDVLTPTEAERFAF